MERVQHAVGLYAQRLDTPIALRGVHTGVYSFDVSGFMAASDNNRFEGAQNGQLRIGDI
jgi:hypothetical protein